MKKGFFSSIRFRANLLFVLVLGLALFFHNALTYFAFRDALHRKLDALLAAKLQAAESTLRTYLETRKTVEVTAPPESRNWFADLFGSAGSRKADQDPYDVVFRHLTRNTLTPDESEPRMAIDVYDPTGRLSDSSRNPKPPLLMDPYVLRRVLANQKTSYRIMLDSENKKIPMRAMAKLVRVDGRPLDIIQTRIPLQSLSGQLKWFMFELALRSLVVLVLVSGGGILLVRFTLRPVDRMTRAIRNIKPDNLDQRLRVPETHDEIARLAETFNRMLERLEKSFRSQRQIVQDISHELKTPLTIIRGQMEVALKKKRDVPEYEEILQSGLEEIQKVRRIVDNLLLLAKFDNPGHELDMRPIELKRLLEDILQDTRILSLEKNLGISFTAVQDASVAGNEVHMDRLFRNLLENAAKYNVPDGRIEVTLDKDKENAWVTIRDTGIGIADPEIEKVFDRFYRVDQARSSREGFGLGLSIVKSIVEAHRGGIQVQSTVGQGTTFRVSLPLNNHLSALSARH